VAVVSDTSIGNGHERDMVGVDDVYIVDFFNASIYPADFPARTRIDVPVWNATTLHHIINAFHFHAVYLTIIVVTSY